MLSRRAFVGKLAAGTAAACAVGIGAAKTVSAREGTTTPSGILTGDGPQGLGSEAVPPAVREVPDASATASALPPSELIRPVALGSVVGLGWRVSDLTGVVDGSFVLTLQNERGRAYRVHVCRNDGRPVGLVYTDQLDLVVMNGGQGDLPTDEGFARAVAEVAHVLAANEAAHPALVAALVPHAERVTRFAAAAHAQLR